MTEKITADIDSNYFKREKPNDITVNWSGDMPDKIWFNLDFPSKENDDYITIIFKISDILHAIGKEIGKKEE